MSLSLVFALASLLSPVAYTQQAQPPSTATQPAPTFVAEVYDGDYALVATQSGFKTPDAATAWIADYCKANSNAGTTFHTLVKKAGK